MTYSEIIDRLTFIKGNVIANERRDALEQIRELLELLQEAELKELESNS